MMKRFARTESQNLNRLTSGKPKNEKAVTAMTAPRVARATVTKVSQSATSVTAPLG
jgi:hypothetical protein